MKETFRWFLFIEPLGIVFLIAAGIILIIVTALITWMLCRKYNYNVWPAESKERFLDQERLIKTIDEDYQQAVKQHNIIAGCTRQAILILQSSDNKIKMVRNK